MPVIAAITKQRKEIDHRMILMISLENTYDNDCELVQLTTSEIAEIEEILKSKTDINLY